MIETKVFGKSMYECPLLRRHGLEPETLFFGAASKDAELAFLGLSPLNTVLIKRKRLGRVWNVVVLVGICIDIEREG